VSDEPPRIAIDQKQRVHARDHCDRRTVLRIHFTASMKLAQGMCLVSHVNQFRPADMSKAA
jgi:hypothetical protein